MSKKSEARKREWADPEIRARRIEAIREAAKRRYESPDQREAARSQFAEQMADPEKAERFRNGLSKARKRVGQANTKHGMCDSPEYKIWSGMTQRCTNPNNSAFHNYGARGITVTPEWLGRGGFARFIEHIGRRPSSGLSIDRIDNEGNYEPGNVRWATRKQQSLNSRKVNIVTIDGVSLSAAEWARRIGISQPALVYRVKAGWSEAELQLPAHARRLS